MPILDKVSVNDVVYDLSVATDKTLGVENKAADAKAVGDKITTVKADLNDIESELYIYDTALVTYTTLNNYRLKSDGHAISDSDYQLKKYQVSPGDMLKVVSDDAFQFQTTSNVPTSGAVTRVGETYPSGEYIIRVPETTSYLIIATPKVGSNANVYSRSAVIESMQDSIGRLYDKTDIATSLAEDVAGSYDLPIPFIGYGYIDLSGSTVTMNDGVPQKSGSSSTFKYGMMQCDAGDMFLINGKGGIQTRLWGFVSNTGDVLAVANENASGNSLKLTAPIDSAWLIIHTNDTGQSYAYVKIKNVVVRYDREQTLSIPEQQQVQQNIGINGKVLSYSVMSALLDMFAHVAWTNENGKKYYDAFEAALNGELPSIYSKVNYIIANNSNSQQYITTDIYMPAGFNNFILETSVNIYKQQPAANNGFGINELVTLGENSDYYIINAERTNIPIKNAMQNIKLISTMDGDQLQWVCKIGEQELSGTRSTFNVNMPLCLFAFITNTLKPFRHMNGAIKSLKLVVDGKLVHNMAAVLRISDNIAGMYDYVTDIFYPSSGSENFDYVM